MALLSWQGRGSNSCEPGYIARRLAGAAFEAARMSPILDSSAICQRSGGTAAHTRLARAIAGIFRACDTALVARSVGAE
jgi:hypothetical protein